MTAVDHLRPDTLLSAERLVQRFKVPEGVLEAVSDVSFDVREGETLGVVGESGCGKSSTGRAVLQLPRPTSGTVWFAGRDLTRATDAELREVRACLQVIFQDPTSALNPRRRVRDVVGEGLVVRGVERAEIGRRVDEALHRVGLDPATAGERRPHEFSGGQCQRIAIARAMVLRPRLIICDEPVASLDVSVQGQVLNLLEGMRAGDGLSLVFISHDLDVVRAISDRVAVMYLGKIVEIGEADSVLRRSRHHYTRTLLDAVPEVDGAGPAAAAASDRRTGEVPSALRPPSGCRFRTRCPYAEARCAAEVPALRRVGEDHHVACHFPAEP
ncbi:ABC transporter ATP-binding protein [Amycolatopsis sp. FDAARGOS 1241]|uniref:ABC transporter ATP-binding protein n=1 Tax=Amycolatopsis sp. FDAARGOS 1241 TaxID=2778070 RepID=UPI0019509B0E|nr:oligopeptide/dipeptide ABC transporter ATP-binding protein [Amycolatopsis sp. FDAARGOS 1241]QRP42863.1 ATP-binding cassette domain-containing protein [Amycolatopsis sp. FDAARGOS 1241]